MQSQTAVSAIISKQSQDPLLTPKETANYLGVTEKTLAVWRCTQRYAIPFIKVGRLVKYSQTQIN